MAGRCGCCTRADTSPSRDVLRVGMKCIELGLDVELHCYGQGSLREPMLRAAAARPDRLHVHDAIPYPDLVRISRSFDLFVCCHVQNDPSCTYLEALGSGLPVVGYANAMWRDMCQVSRAGMCSRMGEPYAVATCVQTLINNRAMLADMSAHALAFARNHLFEAEFGKRIEAINSVASNYASDAGRAALRA
jgi:colanic acid/amylovoran biosynthesis glycosyltransferase